MVHHLKIVSGPAAEPITTADAKTHLRVDFNDDDQYIDSLVAAARVSVENVTHRALITQTWDLYLDHFPQGDYIKLPLNPVSSIVSVAYTTSDDAETTIDAGVYTLADWENPARIVLKYGELWPTATLRTVGAVKVRFVAGYGANGTDVPTPLIQGMKLLIGHMYENRQSVVIGQGITASEVPDAAMARIYPYQVPGV